MDTEKHYNGWTNYETWCVKLWIDNDQGDYEWWREATREVWAEAENGGNPYVEDRNDRARLLLAERLKDEHEERSSDLAVVGVFADLLGAALGAVDWYEIAQSMLDDQAEEGERTA